MALVRPVLAPPPVAPANDSPEEFRKWAMAFTAWARYTMAQLDTFAYNVMDAMSEIRHADF